MIAVSGGSKVGNGVNGFFLVELCCSLLLHVIGGVEFGAGGGALRLAPHVLYSGEESLENVPSFLLCSETFPDFSVTDKETGLIKKLEGDAD